MPKERLDKVMVERGLAATREKAQALVMAGLVSSGGARLDKPGRQVPPDLPLEIEKPVPYVSRGGLKLAEALDAFGIDPAGAVCADIGSSTGGFTDCLLQRGASKVYAVDVDVRQIDSRLRGDPRVVLVEKNARFLEPGDLAGAAGGVDIVVMDVSFISILKILPAVRAVCRPGETTVLTLVKPQFEAGRGQVGRKGIIRDPSLHARILERVAADAADLGYALGGIVRCATRGRQGNQEFFARWTPGGLRPPAGAVLEWIRNSVPEYSITELSEARRDQDK
jgi:23S rRNA (cytidine1920-2'-O)/16S rRNA (cytidine1409-2'-O)-methyltransferase